MGPPGLSAVERVSAQVHVPSFQGRSVIASCPFPKRVIGGGFESACSRIDLSRPALASEGWEVHASTGLLDCDIIASATCANSN